MSTSSSPFTNGGNIQIRLTRNDNADEDDRIVIRYKDEDIYQIFFQDGYVKKPYCTVLTGEELDVYVESLFVLLARDNDPFLSVEFQIPCFPSLQYTPEDLREGKLRGTLKRIMPLLRSASKY
jgi:hypothetical protein